MKSLDELKISQNTVKNYLFRIFNKLGVSSRIEVVLYAASQRRADRTAADRFSLDVRNPRMRSDPNLQSGERHIQHKARCHSTEQAGKLNRTWSAI